MRGAVYTPDLLYKYDPGRDAAILRYVKDLGLNMLRLESKISGEHLVQMADEVGIPLMFGWMCCNQWEKWSQWDDEDQRVSQDSLRSQLLMLRHHASVFVWANGSDGKPPPPVLAKYRDILTELHWQNAIVDTVSSFATDAQGERDWDGIHMTAVQLAPADLLVQRTLRRHPRLVGRAGRQRTHPTLRHLEEIHSGRQALAHQRRMVFPCRLRPEKLCVDQYSARRRASLRFVEQRRGVHPQGPTRALRIHARPVRGIRCQRVEHPQDDHVLDAEQSLAVVLREHIRLLPATRRSLITGKEGAAAVVGGLRSYATGANLANVTVVNQTPNDQQNMRVRVRVYDLRAGCTRIGQQTTSA